MLVNSFILQRSGGSVCTASRTVPSATLCPRTIQGKKELEWAKSMPENSLAVDYINSFVLVLGKLPDTFEFTNLNVALKSQCSQYHSNISLVSKERGHMGKLITTSL